MTSVKGIEMYAKQKPIKVKQEQILSFIDYYRFVKLASANTLVSYCHDLSDFYKYAGSKFPKEVSRLDVRSYLLNLKLKKYSVQTIRRRIATLKAFYRYLRRMEYINHNPFANFVGPRKEYILPKFLNQSEIIQLMELPNTKTLAGKRDLAILETIYSSGLRISELIGLRVCNVEFIARTIKVCGKGNKERIVPIGRYALEAINKYLKSAPIFDKGYIFRNLNNQHITVRSVERIISHYLHQIGRPELSAHSLRHSCATHMFENGASLVELKEFLGHESINTTERYTHTNLKTLKRGYKGFEDQRVEMDQLKLFEYSNE